MCRPAKQNITDSLSLSLQRSLATAKHARPIASTAEVGKYLVLPPVSGNVGLVLAIVHG